MVTADELAELVAEAYGERAPVPLPKPEVSSHAHSAQPAAEAIDHAAMDHGAMGHGGHDMSDPRMAAAMEADMRRRFWISLVLALPVLAYSSLASGLRGLRPPTPFGVPTDWVMLAVATPVALWTSSVFHIGAYYALTSRVLNSRTRPITLTTSGTARTTPARLKSALLQHAARARRAR